MTQRPIQPRRLLALLGAVALLGLLLAASAQAAEAPWGELERFGEKGTGAGQLEAPEYAFGIDQSDGGLWVVDTVAEGTKFRIQKFMKKRRQIQSRRLHHVQTEGPGRGRRRRSRGGRVRSFAETRLPARLGVAPAAEKRRTHRPVRRGGGGTVRVLHRTEREQNRTGERHQRRRLCWRGPKCSNRCPTNSASRCSNRAASLSTRPTTTS